ncbi:putative C-S lyase [Rahnella sp. SAP-1]|uniref:cysteine-S-conjugate beta-lyase n=1 Tax=Rouxiella aceris TaxID=2703884 RepID=A0A848MHW3_9GAMM|nr:PatB family C-S lyase [Rouxiella aceris]NMP26680.1 putative C-S lyase [Rouxiella aceris]
MTFNFDQWVDRSHSDSLKWHKYRDGDVIPLWVADSDFQSPPSVISALQQRVAEGVFGYGVPPAELLDLVVSRMQQKYNWAIQPQWIVWLPGLVCGLHLAVRALTTPQQSCIMPSPIYPPFMQAAQIDGRSWHAQKVEQRQQRWVPTVEQIEPPLNGNEKLLMLCNPYNPGGTVFRREELLEQLSFAQRHNLIVCSDEIHCDLLLEPGARHIPFASLSEDAAERSITLMSPSKTFNIAGLGASLAIIPNNKLRKQYSSAARGTIPDVNILAYVAATAAYRDGEEWLAAQLDYLRANRDLAVARINAMPGLRMLPIEGTYLGWIDTKAAQLNDPYQFFLQAGVALSNGKDFGDSKFVRINLGCQRALLDKALDRMAAALAAR